MACSAEHEAHPWLCNRRPNYAPRRLSNQPTLSETRRRAVRSGQDGRQHAAGEGPWRTASPAGLSVRHGDVQRCSNAEPGAGWGVAARPGRPFHARAMEPMSAFDRGEGLRIRGRRPLTDRVRAVAVHRRLLFGGAISGRTARFFIGLSGLRAVSEAFAACDVSPEDPPGCGCELSWT